MFGYACFLNSFLVSIFSSLLAPTHRVSLRSDVPLCALISLCNHPHASTLLQVEQLTVSTDTKTLDNVSVRVITAIHYVIDFENDERCKQLEKSAIYKAVFTIENVGRQMSAYVVTRDAVTPQHDQC